MLNIHYLCSPVVLIGIAGALGILLHSDGIFPPAHRVTTCTKVAAVQELNVADYDCFRFRENYSTQLIVDIISRLNCDLHRFECTCIHDCIKRLVKFNDAIISQFLCCSFTVTY